MPFKFLRPTRPTDRPRTGGLGRGWSPLSICLPLRHRLPLWLLLGLLTCGLVVVIPELGQRAIAQTPAPTPEAAETSPSPSPTASPSARPSPAADGPDAAESAEGDKPAGEGSPPPERPPLDTTASVTLPETDQPSPVIAAAEPGQYVLEFNRSPVVGNRLRFAGIYDEKRLRFTRPRNWETKSVKLVLRYRHSAALYATRSNLTGIINGTSVGSVPLNQLQGEIGTATFDVPLHLLQDYNELLVTALQNNSPTCTQDPFDPSLWTEVMPDSKLVFDFVPQPITPDFSQFPYPLFDELSLQTNQVTFLQPQAADSTDLTSLARFQAALGRMAGYRPLETRLVKDWEGLQPQERLVVIGMPQSQPALANLDLPLTLKDGQFLDGDGKAIADDIGILMWATLQEGQVPVLVATGNTPEGVAKGVQFLVQGSDRRIGAGHLLLVNQIATPQSPDARDWPGYLPSKPEFLLGDLSTDTQQPIEDVTVRGSHSPALELDFKALPDDQVQPGSSMVLHYSYGPQINPLTSMVEVELNGVAIQGRRLTAVEGNRQETMNINLPTDKITPTSRLRVNFRLDPRERRSCSRVTDQQLWGTIHKTTSFNVPRESIVKLPDLKLLRTGFPFTAPQDLSALAIVVPDNPTQSELTLLRSLLERLGRLSKADSIQLEVYRQQDLPETVRSDRHLIAIGGQAQFPFPEILETGDFSLGDRLTRRWGDSQVQTLPDGEGLAKMVLSPWNQERVLLALSGQTARGLERLADLFRYDPLFFQLEGDTALISAQVKNPDPYAAKDYRLEFLQQQPQVAVVTTPSSRRIWRLLRSNWLFVVPTMIVLTLFMYGVAQAYLRRIAEQDS